jgi:hypothetical protein
MYAGAAGRRVGTDIQCETISHHDINTIISLQVLTTKGRTFFDVKLYRHNRVLEPYTNQWGRLGRAQSVNRGTAGAKSRGCVGTSEP